MARTITKRERKYKDQIVEQEKFQQMIYQLRYAPKLQKITPVLPEDFSKAQPKTKPEKQSEPPIQTVSKEARRRQSLMDNPDNLFVCDMRTGIVHDRDCDQIKQIPDSCFSVAKWLPFEKNRICINCFKKALIRTSVGSSRKYIDNYHHFFNSLDFTEDLLYKLFIENKTSLIRIDMNSVTLKVNEDRWIIVKNNNVIELWHNNYIVCNDYSRVIQNNYHRQGTFPQNGSEGAKEVIAVVCNYSWDTHIYKKNRYDARLKYYEAWHGSSNYFVEKQGRHKTKVLFVDIKDKSKKLLCEAGLKVKFYNEYNNTAYLKYPLRCCKVNSKDFKTFKKVMDKIRETGACDDYYDYATNWFKKEK